MTSQQNHPITPPPKLVQQWDEECDSRNNPEINSTFDALQHFATQAAQWGADQELEACCEWLDNTDVDDSQEAAKHLRAARRPKSLSLKEQALKILDEEPESDDMKELIVFDTAQVEIIRRALKSLPS